MQRRGAVGTAAASGGAGAPPPLARWSWSRWGSAELGDDVLREELELPLRLVEGEQALVEVPREPLELAVTAVDLGHRLDLALDVVDRAEKAVLRVHEAVHRPLGRREWGVRVEGVLLGVLREAERFPEAEAGEVGVEAEVVGALE